MFRRQDSILLFVTYVEQQSRAGRCEVWAQTDTDEYAKLERLVSATAAKKDTCLTLQDITVCDILLALYESDNQWYRVEVLVGIDSLLFLVFSKSTIVK